MSKFVLMPHRVTRTWSWRALGGAGVLAALTPVAAAYAPCGSAAAAYAATPAARVVASAALPAIPQVSLALTDGQNPATLFSNAIKLSSVGIDTSALTAALDVTQAKMDSDAGVAARAEAAVREADLTASRARARAEAAHAAYTSLQSAVQQAAVLLYIDGPAPLTVNPNAGPALQFASDYAESTLTPYGALAQRAADEKAQAAALAQARSAQRIADRDAAKAASAMRAEQAQVAKLTQVLASVASASAVAVEADHTAVAAQSGRELVSASDLQFKLASALPAPLASTPVALTWAFSELGKAYLWGGMGPKAFDCSGLTQFVWHAAGVAIPRVASAQDTWTVPVPLSDLLPGDLVFFGTTDIHHVGIYIGDGLMINAPHTGTVVQVSSIWWSDLSGFGRVHGPAVTVPPHGQPSRSRPARRAVNPSAGPVPSQVAAPRKPDGPSGRHFSFSFTSDSPGSSRWLQVSRAREKGKTVERR